MVTPALISLCIRQLTTGLACVIDLCRVSLYILELYRPYSALSCLTQDSMPESKFSKLIFHLNLYPCVSFNKFCFLYHLKM